MPRSERRRRSLQLGQSWMQRRPPATRSARCHGAGASGDHKSTSARRQPRQRAGSPSPSSGESQARRPASPARQGSLPACECRQPPAPQREAASASWRCCLHPLGCPSAPTGPGEVGRPRDTPCRLRITPGHAIHPALPSAVAVTRWHRHQAHARRLGCGNQGVRFWRTSVHVRRGGRSVLPRTLPGAQSLRAEGRNAGSARARLVRSKNLLLKRLACLRAHQALPRSPACALVHLHLKRCRLEGASAMTHASIRSSLVTALVRAGSTTNPLPWQRTLPVPHRQASPRTARPGAPTVR